jgi:hypothetical protein
MRMLTTSPTKLILRQAQDDGFVICGGFVRTSVTEPVARRSAAITEAMTDTAVSCVMRPDGTPALLSADPGNDLPGYFRSFLRNDEVALPISAQE